MLRVTFCAYDAPNIVGGPISWLLLLLPALRSLDIDTRCLFLTWGDSGPAVKRLGDMAFDCPTMVCRGSTEERMSWILERLRENPPDVFVPNLVVPAYFAAAWARKAGIPTVGILHSDDDFYRAIKSEFVFGHPRFALSSLVCVSRELEKQVISRNPQHTKVKRIPYGVPIPEKSVQQNKSRFRMAYVGRLVEQQKRVSDVTRALCRVLREVPGTEAVIYGDGPDKENVDRILAKEGQGLPVQLGGRIPSDEIQDKLLDCDVIVLLSDYEGLPIAVLEAMACGVVPVCLRVRSGIPELVVDGVTGLVVENRGDAFVGAIRTLKEDTRLWSELSNAARKKVAQENSIQVCAEQWAEHLHSLHENAAAAKKILIPKRLSLPPVHPGLAGEDPRQASASVSKRIYVKGRKFAGYIRRKLVQNH